MNRLLFFILISIAIPAKSQSSLKWYTIEQAMELNKIQPKPIVIDFYTHWCGWCKHMIKTTYSDPQVVSYLNQNFYPVKFNAETKDTVLFEGTQYVNKRTGSRPPHDLAIKLLNGRLSYPTTMFISRDKKQRIPVPGYLKTNDFVPILVYYKEDLHLVSDINDFIVRFKKTFERDSIKDTKNGVKWMSLQSALDANKKSPRKIFVHLDDPACISCKVMDSTTYLNPEISSYINDNFYPVHFNIYSKESVKILEYTLDNPNGAVHPFVNSALKDKPKSYPNILIFNEENRMIMNVPQYMTDAFMKPVLSYFKENAYQKMPYPDYRKTYKP